MVIPARPGRPPAMKTQQDSAVLIDNLIEYRCARVSASSIQQLVVPGGALRYVRNANCRPDALHRPTIPIAQVWISDQEIVHSNSVAIRTPPPARMGSSSSVLNIPMATRSF